MNDRSWCVPARLVLVALLCCAPLTAQAPEARLAPLVPLAAGTMDGIFMAQGLGGGVSGLGFGADSAPPFFDAQTETPPDRRRGAMWGGGIGLIAGALLGKVSVKSDDDGGYFGGSTVESSGTANAALLGAFLGATVGAVLGATVFAPSQRVEAGLAQDQALRLVPRLSPAGVGMSVRLR